MFKKRRFSQSQWHSVTRFESAGNAGSSRVMAELAATYSDAGLQVRRYLLQRYVLGKLSAVGTCSVATLHTQSGGVGVEDLGLPLSRKRGHAAHLDGIIRGEADLGKLYVAEVPGFSEKSCRRAKLEVEINLPSQAIARDVAAGVSDVSEAQFGPNYHEHPAVIEAMREGIAPEKVRRVAL